MKKFVFGLEKALKLRAFREREAEIELAGAIGALTVIENKIKDAAKKRVDAAAQRFLPGQKASEIFNTDLYIIRLDKLRDTLFEEAAGAELVVAAAREKYLAASRERQVVDKLKEKRYTEYKREVLKEEIKTIDDITNGKRARLALLGG